MTFQFMIGCLEDDSESIADDKFFFDDLSVCDWMTRSGLE
jgi:hypothetical protein